MAMIPQKNLFSWKKLEKLPDLKQLEMLFKYLPDEKLMKKLESNRKNGRDDYPVRAMWNSMLAGVIFEHKGIESLRRELKRNPPVHLYWGIFLRFICRCYLGLFCIRPCGI